MAFQKLVYMKECARTLKLANRSSMSPYLRAPSTKPSGP